MLLFNNTRPFLSPSVGCATILLLFSACTAAHAEYRDGDANSRPGETYTPDYDLGPSSLDDVTLTLNYDGKSYTIFDDNRSAADLINIALHLSLDSITGHDADAGEFENDHVDFRCALNPGNRNDDRKGEDEEKFFSSISHYEHRGDITNNYFWDDGDKGHHNNGGSDPNNGYGDNGTSGNGGCGDNGNGNSGGLPATPEPGSVYLSAVAAGLMSVMLVRRGLRLRKATAGVPA